MKRIIFILTLLVFVLSSKAQNPIPTDSAFAIKQSIANAPTTLGVTNALQAKKGIINGVFADTTTANLYNTTTGGYRLKFYPGAQIFTTSDNSFWVRDNTATKWIKANSAGGSSVTSVNDSTIIICNEAGVCDTINLGNSYTFYFITIGDTVAAVVSCDTVVVTCVGDSCYQTQLCDTTLIPGQLPFPTTVSQNWLRKIPGTQITEFGSADPNDLSSQMVHNTYAWTSGYQLNIYGRPTSAPPVLIQQDQWSQLSSSILGINHNGAYTPNFPLPDLDNPVNLYFNYTDRFAIPTQGTLSGDTVGFMGNRYGYLLMTNSQGTQNGYTINDTDAKQVGVMFHTYDTDYTDAVTIFGNQVPSAYAFTLNPPTDSTLLDARIAVFKTDLSIQFPGYPNTRNDGASPNGKGFYADTDGNILYGAIGGSGGGSIVTVLNDSTIEVCNAGSCDTIDIGTPITNLQNVFVINDTTLLVCNVDNTTCDTVDLSNPAVFDRGFFDPNQASLGTTTHNLNSNTFSIVSGSNTNFIINPSSGFYQFGDQDGVYTPGGANLILDAGSGSATLTAGGSSLMFLRLQLDAFTEIASLGDLGFNNNSTIYKLNDNNQTHSFLTGGDTLFYIKSTGQLQAENYGAGTFYDTTANYLLGVQTDGDVIEVPVSSLGGSSITIINDTSFTICSFGDFLCDTFITVSVNPIQYVTIINDSTLQVCDSLGVCDTLNVGGGGSGSGGFDRGVFDPNQISNADTYHQMNGYNFSLGIGLITPPSGYLNMNFLNGNTVQGNENVVFGRNMVVDGNTNFVAATDGTVSNAVNYSATFGDANDQRGTASLLSGFGNDNYVENALVGGNDNVNGALTPGGGTANQYTGSFMIGVNSRSTGSRNGTIGYLVQNTGAQSYIIGSGFGSTRLTNSMGSVIGFGSNSDSITMYVHPAAGTTGSIGKVSIGTSAPTATRLEVVDNAVGAANIVYVSSTSTAAASDVQTGIRVSLSGTNATAGQTTYGAYFLNTHAGTTSETIGARGEASGGTTVNFGLLGVTSSNVGLSAGVYALNTSNGYGLLAETSTSGTAGQGNTASGIGFQGTASSSGIGVRGNSNSGNGVQAYSISGTPLLSFTEHASTNTVVPLIDIYRRSSTTGADGIGASIDIKLETTTTADVLANQIISSYPTATHASRISKLEFTGVTAGATETWLTIGQSGYVKFRPMTVTEAGAIATAEGLMLFVSNTDATFTSVGLWIYQNGAWKAL
jgi:hypothetical protein